MGLFNLFGKKKEQNKESNSSQESPEPLQTAPSSGSVDSSNTLQSETGTGQEPGQEDNDMNFLAEARDKYNGDNQMNEQELPEFPVTERPSETDENITAKTQQSGSDSEIKEQSGIKQETPTANENNEEQTGKQINESGENNLSSDNQEGKKLQNFYDSTSEKEKNQQTKNFGREKYEGDGQNKQTNSEIEEDPDLREIMEEDLPPPPQIDMAANRQEIEKKKEVLKGLSYPEKIELLKRGNDEEIDAESLSGFYKRAFPKELYTKKQMDYNSSDYENSAEQKSKEPTTDEAITDEAITDEATTDEATTDEATTDEETNENLEDEPKKDELFITAKNFRELSEFIDSISSEIRVSQDSVERTRELEKETDVLLDSWKGKLDNSNDNIETFYKIVFKQVIK